MDSNVLAQLLDRNQQFLTQLAQLEASVQELENQGRPLLHQSLETWKHDTAATNTMIQYILNSRQAANTGQATPAIPKKDVSVAQSAATLNQQALFGIWDITLADGKRVELALDDHGNFSYVLLGENWAYWGLWSFDPNAGGYPLISLTRKGGYPVRYYGPLGSTDLVYTEHETWSITAVQGDRINFGGVFMVRRAPTPLPFVTSRISQVQTEFRLADQRDQSNALRLVSERSAIGSVQSTIWDYINSGAGRHRG